MAGPTGATTGSNSTPAKPAPARRAIAGRTAPRATAAGSVAAAASAPAVSAPAVLVSPVAAAPVRAATDSVPDATPAAPSTARENPQVLYGMLVVLAGFVAILIGLWLVVINYKTAADATAILGIITTAIAGLGGAFFGVAIGQQGTSSANKERAAAEVRKDAAQAQALRFAAHMDPNVARRLVE